MLLKYRPEWAKRGPTDSLNPYIRFWRRDVWDLACADKLGPERPHVRDDVHEAAALAEDRDIQATLREVRGLNDVASFAKHSHGETATYVEEQPHPERLGWRAPDPGGLARLLPA